MICAVGDKQNGTIQVRMQRGKDGQTCSAWQPQAGELPISLELCQQLLILREGADVIEDDLHFIYVSLVE